METVQRTAEAKGKSVHQFIEWAVETADKTVLAMGIRPSTDGKIGKEAGTID